MRLVVTSLFLVLVVGVAVLFIPTGVERRVAEVEGLGEFGGVGRFAFTDQEGLEFDSSGLAGKVWVANFVFTSCAVECPVLTRRMGELRERFAGRSDVAFVSFSVDPQTDTPERLKSYAEPYGLDGRWVLLTGDERRLDALIKGTFLLPVARDYEERQDLASAGFIHSNKLVVVDGAGVLRFYYDGLEADATERLGAAVGALLAESGGGV